MRQNYNNSRGADKAKTNVDCRWTDDDMKRYHGLRDRDFTISILNERVKEPYDLFDAVADAVFARYGIALDSIACIKRIIKDLEGVSRKIFDRN